MVCRKFKKVSFGYFHISNKIIELLRTNSMTNQIKTLWIRQVRVNTVNNFDGKNCSKYSTSYRINLMNQLQKKSSSITGVNFELRVNRQRLVTKQIET